MGLPGSVSKVLALQTGGHNSDPNTHIQSRPGGILSVRDLVSKTRWRAIENSVRLLAGSGWDQKKIILSKQNQTLKDKYMFSLIYILKTLYRYLNY